MFGSGDRRHVAIHASQTRGRLAESRTLMTAAWTEGNGGFGTRDTPGARVGTTWATNSIWLRKTFELESVPAKPVLWMHHDEDAEVYINGNSVAVVKGFTSKYGAGPDRRRQTICIEGRDERDGGPLPANKRRPVHRRASGRWRQRADTSSTQTRSPSRFSRS